MIFKRPERHNLLFTTVLLSTSVQEALDTSCDDNGCMFVRLSTILESLGDMSGVIWSVTGGTEGLIEVDPQSTLGSSNDTLQVHSQVDCIIHTEQVIVISRTGAQQFNPDEYGNITLNTASFIIHLPLPEHKQIKMPTFHRYHRADQNQTQFRSNPLHQDPNSIDLNMNTSTQHREATHSNQVRLFPTPPPPLAVAGITSLPPSFLRPGH